jgi:hypothetical protein
LALIAAISAFGLIGSFAIAWEPEDPVTSLWPLVTKLGSMLGATFGVGAGLCWLVTVSPQPMMRVVCRILIVAVFGYALAVLRVSEWLQHALNLAGLVLFQSIWFTWLGVPGWAKFGAEMESSNPSRKQFRVADLLAMTAGTACLLGLVIGFAPPVAAEIYWFGLFTIWVGGPLVAASFVLASLARSLTQAVQGLLAGACLVGLISVSLTVAQSFVTGVPVKAALTVPHFYAMFFWTFGVTLLGIGFAGRFQAIWPASEPKAPAAGPTVE